MPARLEVSLQTIVVAIAWTMAIAAPVGAAMRAMTLEEALSFARAHQPALRSALARVSAAAADTRVPRAQWLPTVGATLQGFEGTANNTTASYIGAPKVDLLRIGGTPVTGTGSLSPATSTLAAIGAGQEVFDFGRIAAQSAVADVAYEAERHHADGERLRVALLVKEAYYGVLGARAVLLAAEDAHQRAQGHRDMAAAGVKSGLHAPIELTRVEAELARFEVERIRAGGSLRSAQAVLAAAVGADEALLDAAGEAAALPAAPPLSEAVKRAASADPALQEARSRADAADALVRAISAENRPDLALTATVSGRAGTAAPSSGSPSDKYGPLPTVPNWDVGLVLRWNVYDPIVAARRGSAAARSEVARADLSVLTQHEVAAVQEAYVEVEVSQAALSSLGRAVEAAHANYAQAEARFKAGLGTSLELADAETVRTDAEIQLAVGEFDVRRARAFLARLLAEDL